MAAAIKGLAYRPFINPPDETKAGFVYYDGSARHYRFWKFKTEVKATEMINSCLLRSYLDKFYV